MSSLSRIDARRAALAALIGLGALVGGCSDIYFDRRETIALGAGDAVASNRVTHMVDPWPRSSANRNLAFDGERMQAAVERYRKNKVTAPVNASTSSVEYQRAAAAAATLTQAMTAPAAPVK